MLTFNYDGYFCSLVCYTVNENSGLREKVTFYYVLEFLVYDEKFPH